VLCCLVPGVALAEGPFDGVFVTEQLACQWLEQEGAQAHFEHDFLSLTLAEGINANEFHCDFLDTKATGDGSALVITAFCEYPGEPYPDLIALREFDEQSISVSSMHDHAEDLVYGREGWQGTDLYYRCENLKVLPR
jgi:hypothetical protein